LRQRLALQGDPLFDRNDETSRRDGAKIVAIDGSPSAPAAAVETDFAGRHVAQGHDQFHPAKGWQMEPIWLPPPEAVVARLGEIARGLSRQRPAGSTLAIRSSG
jgi:taurine transport system permease protein